MLRTIPRWQASSGLRQIRQEPDGSVGVSTRVAEVWHYLGRTIEATSEVTAFEPNREYMRHALGTTGPIKRAEFAVEVVTQGTCWTAEVHLQPSGFIAIALPVIGEVWNLVSAVLNASVQI